MPITNSPSHPVSEAHQARPGSCEREAQARAELRPASGRSGRRGARAGRDAAGGTGGGWGGGALATWQGTKKMELKRQLLKFCKGH